jgi:hypothetical protein
MGRNPFRKITSSGTLDDGSSAPGANITISNSSPAGPSSGYASFPLHGIFEGSPTGWGSATTMVSGQAYYWPFMAHKSGNITSMTVSASQAASSAYSLYVAIYETLSTGWPGALLGYCTWDGTTLTAAQHTQTSFSSTITLEEGKWYWYAQVGSGSQTAKCYTISTSYAPGRIPWVYNNYIRNNFQIGVQQNASTPPSPAHTSFDNPTSWPPLMVAIKY